MPAARIDRLTIDAGQMATADARRLILLVAAGLADRGDRAGGQPAGAAGLRSKPAAEVEQLAGRIVAETIRKIGRAP